MYYPVYFKIKDSDKYVLILGDKECFTYFMQFMFSIYGEDEIIGTGVKSLGGLDRYFVAIEEKIRPYMNKMFGEEKTNEIYKEICQN